MGYRQIPNNRTIIKTHVDLCKRSGHDPICDEHLDTIERSMKDSQEELARVKAREAAEKN